jgi:hypothetical protein
MSHDPFKPKWCPFVRRIVYYFTDDGTEMLASGNRSEAGYWGKDEGCIGPDCMAWRRGYQFDHHGKRSQEKIGYCGLAGPP